MTVNDELVTVAIPTRNRIQGLVKALSSVIAQTYKNLEIIVSDNNSGGDVKGALSAFADTRVKYFKHGKDLSMTENWNFCLKQAAGKYFLLLSDDDHLVPGAVAELLEAFREGKPALVYGRAVFRGAGDEFLGLSRSAPALEPGEKFIDASLSGKRHALPSATLFITEAARRLGGYPETGNSTDLALRLALATLGPVACVARPILEYSIHPGALSFDPAETSGSFLKLGDWAGATASPLKKWHNKVKQYCVSSLRARARASSLRGEAENASSLLKTSNLISHESMVENVLVKVLSWRAVRYLAGAARLFRKNLMGFFFRRRK